MKLLLVFLLFLLVCCCWIDVGTAATKEELTLRDIQIVFRHGDRAPLDTLFPNDPFSDERKFWPNGLNQLTILGRARLFRLGQYFRERYSEYLGNEFSPQEVFARSSSKDRCLQSAQLVLAGAYPPNSSHWQWDLNSYPLPLAKLWQPISLISFLPPKDDVLLRVDKPCPIADQDRNNDLTSPKMIQFLNRNKQLLEEISLVAGKRIETIKDADLFFEHFNIEHLNGYYWSDSPTIDWTREKELEIYKKLKPFSVARWNSGVNSSVLHRARAGDLLATIGENFLTKKALQGNLGNQITKISLFSTHDTKIVSLMFALKVWNYQLIPFASTLIFELYQNSTDFYVKLLYLNETMNLLNEKLDEINRKLNVLKLPECGGKSLCQLDRFYSIVNKLKPIDWNEECGIKDIDTNYNSNNVNLNDNYNNNGLNSLFWINMLLLIVNLTVLFTLLLCLMRYWNGNREGYQKLK